MKDPPVEKKGCICCALNLVEFKTRQAALLHWCNAIRPHIVVFVKDVAPDLGYTASV